MTTEYSFYNSNSHISTTKYGVSRLSYHQVLRIVVYSADDTTNLSSSHRNHLTGTSGVTAIHKPMFRIQRNTSLTSIDVRRHAFPIRNLTAP